MTHGEAWFIQYQSEVMENGVFVPTIDIEVPEPMEHEDAVKYYNTKLFAYWMDQLDDQISIERKSKIINYLMFGDHTRETTFKDGRE